jgi:hypothetical protein
MIKYQKILVGYEVNEISTIVSFVEPNRQGSEPMGTSSSPNYKFVRNDNSDNGSLNYLT